MKIAITGGAGFIGSNLVKALNDIGETDIIVIDNLSATGNLDYLKDCEYKFININLNEINYADNYYKLLDIDLLIHLAAAGNVIDSVKDPSYNFESNVMGTYQVLQACKYAGIKKIIFASTGGAIMGEAKLPVDENSIPQPVSPYGASKLAGEAYLRAFCHSYDMKGIALRFANIYGPNSLHKKGVINTFIKNIIKGNPLKIFGKGDSTRDYLHVSDLCKGIISAITSISKQENPMETFHLSSGKETSIMEIISILLNYSVMGHNYPLKFIDNREGEVQNNFASNEKAKRLLNFNPEIDLKTGLKEMWYYLYEGINK